MIAINRNQHIRNRPAYKAALCSVLISLALIFSYIEMLIPFNFGVPGIKLGLSNLIIVVAIYRLGTVFALTVNLMRIFLAGLLFGGISPMMYSLAGGIVSFAVMFILYKTNLFSPVGVSMAGGVMHNAGQLTVAALIVETSKIYLYMPVLLISGMITGILLGIIAALLLKKLKYN